MIELNISKRNKLNAESRWKKIQYQEEQYIKNNKNKFLNLKSRLFGYLAGDGNILIGNGISNFHHTVRFFPDHESMIQPFCKAFDKIYNKIPKVKKLQNHYLLSVDSKIVVKDIINSAKFGVLNWKVPHGLLYNKENKKEWLRAFLIVKAMLVKTT